VNVRVILSLLNSENLLIALTILTRFDRHGVKQRNLEVLCVSQFTLYGTLSKKNQPDYKLSMKAIPAQALYIQFLTMLKESYQEDKIFDGKFGAMMDVELINDGPVTIVIDSEPLGGINPEDGEESLK